MRHVEIMEAVNLFNLRKAKGTPWWGRIWASVFLLVAMFLLVSAPLLLAQSGENLVKNPGFEEPAVDYAHLGWTFVYHGQELIVRGQITRQEYRRGRASAMVEASEKPEIYVAWSHHIFITEGIKIPNRLTLWYKAPDNAPHLVISPATGTEHTGSTRKILPEVGVWTKFETALDIPPDTTFIHLELRVYHEGTYWFDDVTLTKEEVAITREKELAPPLVVEEGIRLFEEALQPLLREAHTFIYEGETHAWDGEPIKDQDASGGWARWACPLKHPRGHGRVFSSGHLTKPLPGKYEVTFRLKITEKPEIPARVGFLWVYNHSGEGTELLFSKHKTITTADFEFANRYQDFVLPLVRYDVSFAVLALDWHREVEIFVDRVTLTPIQLFTDKELSHRRGITPQPLTGRKGPDEGWHFLVVAGPYHRHYRLSEALEVLENASVSFHYAIYCRLGGARMKPSFPAASDLLPYSAIILLDVPAAPFLFAGRLALKEYIKGGGGLFVAGGPFAFGKGGYEGTFIGDILPVDDGGPWGLLPAREGDELSFKKDPLLQGLFEDEKPSVSWYHRLKLKENREARILLSIGETPILTLGRYQLGRLAVLGVAPLGKEPTVGRSLLACPDWPLLFSRLLTWVARGDK